MKILLILLIIILLVIIVSSLITKWLRKLFAPFDPKERSKATRRAENGEVLYNKDDIVVLKGEAGKNQRQEKKR